MPYDFSSSTPLRASRQPSNNERNRLERSSILPYVLFGGLTVVTAAYLLVSTVDVVHQVYRFFK